MTDSILLESNDFSRFTGHAQQAFASVVNRATGMKSEASVLEDSNLGDGAKKMDAAYKKITDSVGRLENALKDQLASAFEVVADTITSVLARIQNAVNGLDFKFLFTAAENAQSSVEGFIQSMSETGAFEALKQAFNDVGAAIVHITESLKETGALETLGMVFGHIVTAVSKAVSAISEFIAQLDPAWVTGIVTGITGVILGFKGLNFLGKFNPFGAFSKNANGALVSLSQSVAIVVQGLATGISTLVEGISSGLSTVVEGIGVGLSAAFQGLGTALQMANPANILAIGAAVFIMAMAFSLLAEQSEGVSMIIQSIVFLIIEKVSLINFLKIQTKPNRRSLQ